MKIVTSLKEPSLLGKGASETIENEAKNKGWSFWDVIRHTR